METKKEFKDIPGMFEGPVLPVLIKLSVPMLAGMVFPIMFLAMALVNGMMTGTSSLVARAIGEKIIKYWK